jgi:integrase
MMALHSREKKPVPANWPRFKSLAVLEAEEGEHPNYCFTYRGARIVGAIGNTAWHVAVKRARLLSFRFRDLRHTWASWHRQSGTSTDELKELGGWKSRVMVDRYAKFATEHLAVAAARIESGAPGRNVGNVLRFPDAGERQAG